MKPKKNKMPKNLKGIAGAGLGGGNAPGSTPAARLPLSKVSANT